MVYELGVTMVIERCCNIFEDKTALSDCRPEKRNLHLSFK